MSGIPRSLRHNPRHPTLPNPTVRTRFQERMDEFREWRNTPEPSTSASEPSTVSTSATQSGRASANVFQDDPVDGNDEWFDGVSGDRGGSDDGGLDVTVMEQNPLTILATPNSSAPNSSAPNSSAPNSSVANLTVRNLSVTAPSFIPVPGGVRIVVPGTKPSLFATTGARFVSSACSTTISTAGVSSSGLLTLRHVSGASMQPLASSSEADVAYTSQGVNADDLRGALSDQIARSASGSYLQGRYEAQDPQGGYDREDLQGAYYTDDPQGDSDGQYRRSDGGQETGGGYYSQDVQGSFATYKHFSSTVPPGTAVGSTQRQSLVPSGFYGDDPALRPQGGQPTLRTVVANYSQGANCD